MGCYYDWSFYGKNIYCLDWCFTYKLIVTLPVEFDASSRALSILNDRYLVQDEYFGAKKMLTAAALTYVAGMLSTLLSLLRIVLVVLGNDRGRD